MIRSKVFQHINGRRDRASFAIFHRLGKTEGIEKNVAELARRSDVEFNPSNLMNLFLFDPDLTFELRRHFRKRGSVDLYSGLFHTRQHRHEGEIDLFIQAAQPRFLYFVAKNRSQASGDVGGLSKVAAKFEIETAQSDLR